MKSTFKVINGKYLLDNVYCEYCGNMNVNDSSEESINTVKCENCKLSTDDYEKIKNSDTYKIIEEVMCDIIMDKLEEERQTLQNTLNLIQQQSEAMDKLLEKKRVNKYDIGGM